MSCLDIGCRSAAGRCIMWKVPHSEIAQRSVNARDHTIPRVRVVLPKQAGGRIPGTVVTIEQPAPVGREWQHHPERFCQRTGEVNDAGIDGDHEVQIRDQCCGIGEIFDFVTEMQKVASFFQYCRVRGAHALLQAYECRIDIQER